MVQCFLYPLLTVAQGRSAVCNSSLDSLYPYGGLTQGYYVSMVDVDLNRSILISLSLLTKLLPAASLLKCIRLLNERKEGGLW